MITTCTSLSATGLLCLIALSAAAVVVPRPGPVQPALCPEPQSMAVLAEPGELSESTVILFEPRAFGAEAAARFLAACWRAPLGYPLPVQPDCQPLTVGAVRLAGPATPEERQPPEGYLLRVNQAGVRIVAADAAGFFYGVQTLRQLLEASTFSAVRQDKGKWGWLLPAVEIRDAPRFGWRGLMLDESRHFMGKAAVFKILDGMASLKLNRFHWHLTDSPGWRLEIKRFPALTAAGAVGDHSDPKRAAQFYTQDDVREILDYARARHIMVIPEIELPAHATAAMRAYPHLSCTGKPEFMYCAGNDEAIRFLEQVLDETLALFDAPFIHIGGDECPKDIWKKCPKCQARKAANGLKDEHELQSWMVRHFDQYLTKRGRRLIGWDEILEGGLAPGAAVMSWRGVKGGQAAAAMGHDVVMSPTTHLYLDYPQTAATDGYAYFRVRVNSCERIISFDPLEGIPADKQKHVLGLQGNLWAETCYTGKEAEWKLFPRAAAIADKAWSRADQASWATLEPRLPEICERLKAMGLHVSPYGEPAWYKPVASWKTGEQSETWGPRDWDVTKGFGAAGAYTVRLIYTRGKHQLQFRNVTLLENGVVIGNDARQGAAGANPKSFDYTFTLPAAAKPGAVYTLRAEVRSDGGNDSNGTLCVFPAKLGQPNP